MDQIAKDDPSQEQAVKERKAGLYKHIKKYPEAIKLYREVGKPPSSLWNIAECYHKMGNIKSAVAALTEVENAFPDSAPEAALKKTRIYHGAKNKKMAILPMGFCYPGTGKSGDVPPRRECAATWRRHVL